MQSSNNRTGKAVFALFAYWAFDTPRSGVLVAMREAGVPATLGPLLATVVVAGAVGTLGVVVLGDRVLVAVGALPYRPLVGAVLVGLAALAVGFAGAFGLLVFVAAGAVGFVPVRLGCRRVHLMGVLLGPLILG